MPSEFVITAKFTTVGSSPVLPKQQQLYSGVDVPVGESVHNGQTHAHVASYRASDVDLVHFVGGDGNDDFRNNTSIRSYAYGGNGNDFMRGGADRDLMYGQAGHDNMYGDSGNDYLSGGDGNDNMWGGAGRDYFNGGSGFDRARDLLRFVSS